MDYENKAHREKAFNVTKDKIKSGAGWQLRKYELRVKVGELEKSSGKLDQLAVDSDGFWFSLDKAAEHTAQTRMVPSMTPRCTVRHINSCSTSGSGTAALEEVRTDVQKLIDARVELGLRRLDVTRLADRGSTWPDYRFCFRLSPATPEGSACAS